MAEATPVAEESTMNRSSSQQIGAEFHPKTNGSSSSGEANSADSALGQEELPEVRPSSQTAFSFQYY